MTPVFAPPLDVAAAFVVPRLLNSLADAILLAEQVPYPLH
jgi:hypothetical protein